MSDYSPGVAAGSPTTFKGGSADLLCLPEDPQWHGTQEIIRHWATIHGAEFGIEHFPFSLPYKGVKDLTFHNVPCAVCQSVFRSSLIMVPAMHQCFSNWTIEYTGYLVSGNKLDAGRSGHFCLDNDPDPENSGYRNEMGPVLVPVETKCGALPCPPYEENYELPCVVCTK